MEQKKKKKYSTYNFSQSWHACEQELLKSMEYLKFWMNLRKELKNIKSTHIYQSNIELNHKNN